MDSMRKYDKIKHVGDEDAVKTLEDAEHTVLLQEKFDGANFRFKVSDGKLWFGTRGQVIGNEDDYIESNFINFQKARDYIIDKVDEEFRRVYEGYTIFGEAMFRHTLDYDWDEMPPFIAFDMCDCENDFFNPLTAKKMLDESGFKTPNTIRCCKVAGFSEFKDNEMPVCEYPPKYNPEQQVEGVVIKNIDNKHYAKYVRSQFKEEHKKTFGGSGKRGEYHEKIVYKYCTNHRIEKAIQKFLNEGHEFDMSLTPKVSSYVYQDIWAENMKKIIKSRSNLNLGAMYKLVTDRCRSIISNMLINKQLRGDKS